jgi:translocation and assembly module TamB
MKLLRLVWAVVATFIMALLALAATAWVWSGTATSLATALSLALPYLPAGQTLAVDKVSGSLREGGQIGTMRWQGEGLKIEATDLRVGWAWQALLQGELRLSQLTMRQLRVETPRAADQPSPPPELPLPLRVDAAFSVAQLDWMGTVPLQLRELSGHYVFDSNKHRLDKGQVRISSGNYQLQGELQARAPMALSLAVSGTVPTRIPNSQRSLTLQAEAQLKGSLAGPKAELTLQARLQPALSAQQPERSSANRVNAQVEARLQPWQPQPVLQATANWQGLDLSALWPQAPQTQSSGRATVTPSDAGWRADVKLDNLRTAAIDQQGLQLEKLALIALYRDAGWTIESLLATGAGGQLEGRGSFTAPTSQAGAAPTWRGTATLRGINPQALHSRLVAGALDGDLTLSQSTAGLAIDADLQARPGKRPTASTIGQISQRLKALSFEGLWLAPVLQLSRLDVHTDDARLTGQGQFDTQSQAARGQVQLTHPGGSAALAGTLSSNAGGGELSLRLTDAALAARWLARWPAMPTNILNLPTAGELTLAGQWAGGWDALGRDLQLTLALRVPRLDLTSTDTAAPSWRLQDWQADLSGPLNALALSARGRVERGGQRFELQTRARAAHLDPEHWQLQLDQTTLALQEPSLPGRWLLQTSQGTTLDWRQSSQTDTLSLSAGSLQLTGPAPGTAKVVWQPARWSRPRAPAQAPADWQSEGRIEGLPLAWLELLGQTQIANLGLRGNLLFGGQWETRGGARPQTSATLTRSSGDLQLLAEEVPFGTLSGLGNLNAGVKDASVRLLIDGELLKTQLNWDSERAGQAQAAIESRLQNGPSGWSWPDNAPLSGSLRVQLPPVGAWSLLAPPGWRLRGTLNADATVYGTRAAPLWRGRFTAQDLAVRSVADGIDFSQGQLRVRLDGQSLDIEEFTLHGAPLAGSSGGTVTVTGNVRWPLADGPATAPLLSRLRMALVAEARGLRVSARVDRRLVVSGQLKANLDADQLALRGTLTADQALFILPEDTAPQLGDDVQVRRPGKSAGPETPAKTTASLRVRPDVLLTLDLGQDFQVRGRGLSTRVAGSVTLRNASERSLAPLLRGELRTVQGSYKAYGQQLDIEAGLLRFAGPYDNPALDILAIRPNLQQRVGVQITGTAIAPVVRLYAEPELPEAEKLAWLVLGRGAGTGGAEAAVLQQAALALLGGSGRGLPGSLGQALGLDEVTMRGSTSNADGTATGASVTLGKRLSRDFYVAYERSLAGTLGTLYIFFDLSRRLTLRAQTGEQSAVDLIFTLRYD